MNIKKTGLLVVTVIILFMLIACSNTTEFIITFDSNGGSKVENISYDGKQKITLPNNPTKEGYTFNGWFNNANFTGDSITEITSDTTDDMTLYAQWTINQYTITYGIFGDDYDASLGIPIYSGEKIIQVSLGLHHS